jgi:hypothetical protein
LNNGSSWIDAWTTIQTAFDTAVAADIVYCRGTQVTVAAIDVDTQTGTNAAGFIKFIGCNAAGVVDGTRLTINANDGAYHGITFTNKALYWFENIRVTNTGIGAFHGWYWGTAGATGFILINCVGDNCGGSGFSFSSSLNFSVFFRCVAYLNTSHGFTGRNNKLYFCCARDNTGDGFNGTYFDVSLIGCISHGNTGDGCAPTAAVVMFNSVMDGNAQGIDHTAGVNLYSSVILGCRITNNTISGIDCNAEPDVLGFNYFEDNGAGAVDNVIDDTIVQLINTEGTIIDSNLYSLADTEEGYVDKAGHDFSTRYVNAGDPDLRRVAITVPWS